MDPGLVAYEHVLRRVFYLRRHRELAVLAQGRRLAKLVVVYHITHLLGQPLDL